MKWPYFLPLVHIDVPELGRLHTGDLVLRRGQWVQLAWLDKPSRWVGITPHGTMHISHEPGTFPGMVAAARRAGLPAS